MWISLRCGYCQWQMSLPQHHLDIQFIQIVHTHRDTFNKYLPKYFFFTNRMDVKAQIESHVNMFSLFVYVYSKFYQYELWMAEKWRRRWEWGGRMEYRNFSKALGASNSFRHFHNCMQYVPNEWKKRKIWPLY